MGNKNTYAQRLTQTIRYSSANDFSKFMTATFVASGICLPVVLYHTQLVVFQATVMSTVGGLLIYSSIILFTMFFQESQEEF